MAHLLQYSLSSLREVSAEQIKKSKREHAKAEGLDFMWFGLSIEGHAEAADRQAAINELKAKPVNRSLFYVETEVPYDHDRCRSINSCHELTDKTSSSHQVACHNVAGRVPRGETMDGLLSVNHLAFLKCDASFRYIYLTE